MSKQHGFTLIELILVIVLLGIVSTTILPKLSLIDTSAHEFEFRDRLISLLRHSQLQAMQNTSSTCNRVLISSTRFGQQNDCSSNTIPSSFASEYLGITATEANSAGITFTANNSSITTIIDVRFNALGQPTQSCNGGCTIQLTGSSTTNITIEAQGYIHR